MHHNVTTRHTGWFLCLGAIVALSASGCTLVASSGEATYTAPPSACEASGTDGSWFSLSPNQASNAATINAVSLVRGMPNQAAKIAVATAMQESSLRNIDYGDRDSLGLFQQRPSQGWGSPDEIQDPIYSSNAFYDALAEVPGYTEMALTVAAQTVQRSGFPDAYAKHEPMSTAWTTALAGVPESGLVCTFPTHQEVGDAAQVIALANRDFGSGLTVNVVTPSVQPQDQDNSGAPDETADQPEPPADADADASANTAGGTTLKTLTLDSGNLAATLGRTDNAVVNEAVARWSVAQAYGLKITSITTATGQQWTPRGKWTDVSTTNPGAFAPDTVTIVVATPMD